MGRRRLLLGLLLVTLLLTLPAYSLVCPFLPTIKLLAFQGARVSWGAVRAFLPQR